MWLDLTDANGICSGSIFDRHAVEIKRGQTPAQAVSIVMDDCVCVDIQMKSWIYNNAHAVDEETSTFLDRFN